MPEIALIRVDLPAPLSPTRAATSPAPTSKSTSVSARTAPKLLLTPFSSSRGCFDPTACCVAVASVTSLLPLRCGPLCSLSTSLLHAVLLARRLERARADLARLPEAVLDDGVLDVVSGDRDGLQQDRGDLLLAVVGLAVDEAARGGLALDQGHGERRRVLGLGLDRLVHGHE